MLLCPGLDTMMMTERGDGYSQRFTYIRIYQSSCFVTGLYFLAALKSFCTSKSRITRGGECYECHTTIPLAGMMHYYSSKAAEAYKR